MGNLEIAAADAPARSWSLGAIHGWPSWQPPAEPYPPPWRRQFHKR